MSYHVTQVDHRYVLGSCLMDIGRGHRPAAGPGPGPTPTPKYRRY